MIFRFCVAARFLPGLHAQKGYIHHDHGQRDRRHGHPKTHVESEQARCSEQRHPNILPVHCVPSLTAARRGDEHRLFSSWSPTPCRAGCRYSLSAFISSQGTGRKPGGEIWAFSSAANGTVFQVTLYRQIRTKELSLTRKLLCSVAGVAGDQCSAFVGQAFVHS